jgi:hypothetical protein
MTSIGAPPVGEEVPAAAAAAAVAAAGSIGPVPDAADIAKVEYETGRTREVEVGRGEEAEDFRYEGSKISEPQGP